MDERKLIQRMKSGDRASFDEIYEKYHIPLFRCAYLRPQGKRQKSTAGSFRTNTLRIEWIGFR